MTQDQTAAVGRDDRGAPASEPNKACNTNQRPRRTSYPDLAPRFAAGGVTTADQLPTPGPLCTVRLAGGEHRVQPIPDAPGADGRYWRLVRWGVGSHGHPVYHTVGELDDPEDGCSADGYLGLTCSCRAFEASDGREPCDHLVGLVALRLLRPAPDWGSFDAVFPDSPDDLVAVVGLDHPVYASRHQATSVPTDGAGPVVKEDRSAHPAPPPLSRPCVGPIEQLKLPLAGEPMGPGAYGAMRGKAVSR
jgi:hypothetical protein